MASSPVPSNALLAASILASPSLPAALRQLPNAIKSLSEHKLKRLSILTFINENKTILFTKKAYKNEKELIWKQVFERMLSFGMVSKEKDWRYVRDVSFSNWRKRAQKRLRVLAQSGYCLNMDECEFLIHDMLGKTPDKAGREGAVELDDDDTADWASTGNGNGAVPDVEMSFDEQFEAVEAEDDDESDEYMIDSNEEDDEPEDEMTNGQFDEMLFVPKIVFTEPDTHTGSNTSNEKADTTEAVKSPLSSAKPRPTNGHQQQQPANRAPSYTTDHFNPTQGATRFSSKLREMRLLDLEIENKLLKNRLMKLKVFEMEQNLGLDHCNEVKDLFASAPTKLKMRG